jgi:hypothetical protein
MKRRFQREIIHELRTLGSTRSPLIRNNSSNTKGSDSASAKGHPTMAPVAKSIVTNKVLCLFFTVDGSSAYANASVVAYIANEEGKKAVWVLIKTKIATKPREVIVPGAAFHMPALNNNMKNK